MKNRKLSVRGYLAGFAIAVALVMPAIAAGIFPGFQNWPASSFSGSEIIPMDTLLSAGQNPQTATATTSAVSQFVLGAGASQSATETAGAVTLNARSGVITTASLTTASAADYTLVLSNTAITCSSIVFVTVANGSNTTAGANVSTVDPCRPGPAQVTIKVRNNSTGAAALNGTLKIGFWALQ